MGYRWDDYVSNQRLHLLMKITAKKPSPPKARKTAGLKVKKVSLKAKNDASLRPKKLSATKFLALDKTDDGQFHKKAMQKRKALKDNDGEDKRGVIVLSNIPHGFFEGEMARYFRQFGVLEDIKLVRSKKFPMVVD
ncbi:Ribosome biogenesis protein 15 [Chionoecetes opilio]|uniref:Ribosome biogenesis protein 15 n=1 Tax=Chionoecetes opilio TaxID=41210 RepID=A0A8J4XQI9_CHIOP|nr:Ribosome biogenesis protein 15 [Chionoecetes opilio]